MGFFPVRMSLWKISLFPQAFGKERNRDPNWSLKSVWPTGNKLVLNKRDVVTDWLSGKYT